MYKEKFFFMYKEKGAKLYAFDCQLFCFVKTYGHVGLGSFKNATFYLTKNLSEKVYIIIIKKIK